MSSSSAVSDIRWRLLLAILLGVFGSAPRLLWPDQDPSTCRRNGAEWGATVDPLCPVARWGKAF